MAQTNTEHIKCAKKDHRCEWCWTKIDAGTAYSRYRWFDGGDAATVKMHDDCYQAMLKTIEMEGGGQIEFMPGNNERGHFCGFDKECNCLKHTRVVITA